MKTILLCLLFLTSSLPAYAEFTSRVSILTQAEVAKLGDDKLIDALENVLVEIDAIKTFHATSGFTPAQYDEYRDLLKYRLQLLMEIHNRNLEIPSQLGG